MSLGSPIISTAVGPLIKVKEDGYFYYFMTVSAERVIIAGHSVYGSESYAKKERKLTVTRLPNAVDADTRDVWVGLVNWAALYTGREHPLFYVENRAFYEPEERVTWDVPKRP